MFTKTIATLAILVSLSATATVTLPTAEAEAAGGRNAAFVAGAVTGLAVGAIATHNVHWRGYPHRHYRPYYPRRHYRPYRAPHYGTPRPWTRAWYRYCHSKYRSFNPRTGYFTTYSGHKRFCR
ncbi:BA14K family protein [uncultured Cohaesibacter sp.]|uniref:BA14K family protein n=1 Tax=uncultured Cohaesibacter sp. TaxID=1002546 RepID=UPI0029C7DB23|nr:BA14K family protein [uncultured Cohaesibacter sp.]